MHRLKSIEETLVTIMQTELGDYRNAKTEELGKVTDMIKDLCEAQYYCAKKKAIEEKGYEEEEEREGYRERMYYPRTNMRPSPDYRPSNRESERNPMEYPMPLEMRDRREGKSPVQRKNYMESKELHHDTNKNMKELDKYLQELCEDILEMVSGMTPQEKQATERKLTTLAQTINN